MPRNFDLRYRPSPPQRWTLWRWPDDSYAHASYLDRGWHVAVPGDDIPRAAETVEVEQVFPTQPNSDSALTNSEPTGE